MFINELFINRYKCARVNVVGVVVIYGHFCVLGAFPGFFGSDFTLQNALIISVLLFTGKPKYFNPDMC